MGRLDGALASAGTTESLKHADFLPPTGADLCLLPWLRGRGPEVNLQLQQNSLHSDEPPRLSVKPASLEQQNGCKPPDGAHNRAKAWCLRLGMCSSAWHGFGKMHVNPLTAIQHSVASDVGLAVVSAYTATGLPFNHSWVFYVVTCSHMINTIGLIGISCVFWRVGPALACHRLFPAIQALVTLLSMPILYAGYLGPLFAVPWHNRLKFVCVNAFSHFFLTQAALAGKIQGEHPAEPRTSIIRPMLEGTIRTLQMVDALTDLSMIRTLIDVKSDGCWWFGESGLCSTWTALIVGFSLCAATDFSLVVANLNLGKEVEETNERKRRNLLTVECVCLVCEVGVMLCTLLYLFSEQRSARSRNSSDLARETQNQIVLSFLSLATTICTSTIRLVGVSKTLTAAHTVLRRISGAVQPAFSVPSRRPSATSTVAPLPQDLKETNVV